MIFAFDAEVKVFMEATGGVTWTINNFQKENNRQKKSALKPNLSKRKMEALFDMITIFMKGIVKKNRFI